MKSKNKLIASCLVVMVVGSVYLVFYNHIVRPGRALKPQTRKIYNGILDMEPPDAALAPRRIAEVHSVRLARQVYNSLVAYDSSFNIVGDLASRWQISADGKTYRFVLKGDIFFHDGTRMTADDVVASLRKLGEEDSTQKDLWSLVRRVEIIDDKSFLIELKRKFPPFLDFLTTIYASVAKINKNSKPMAIIGTGPYQIVEWQPKRLIHLKRNPLYYGEKPKIDEINFFIPSTPEAIKDLAKKVVLHDLGWYNPPLGKSEAGNYIELDIPSLQVSGICLNISRPPFNDYEFRKAFVKAFDKEAFISKIYSGARIASGYLPFGLLGHNPDIPENYFASNADTEILKKYPGKIAIVAGINTESDHAKEKTYFSDTYGKRGLDVSVSYLSDKDFLGAFLDGKYDGIKISNEADFPDAYAMLSYFTGKHPMTFLRGGDKKIDEMLVGAMNHADRNERARAYGKIDKYIADHYYMIPLYYNTRKRRFHKSLKGIQPSLLGEHLFSIARLDIND